MITIPINETFRKLVQHENSIHHTNEPFEIEGFTFELVHDSGVEFSDLVLVSKGTKDIGYIWHEYDNCIHIKLDNQEKVILFNLDTPKHLSEKEIMVILNTILNRG